MIELIWWLSALLIFYTYIGYGILLYVLLALKKKSFSKEDSLFHVKSTFIPPVTIIVAAYNEADFIQEKINNTLALNYPKGKIDYLFVTDGSDDDTPSIVNNFPQIHHLHQPVRKGKIAAIKRAMREVNSSVVIYTDANTYLNTEAINNIVRHYQNPLIGGVAGEKRITSKLKDNASGAGEGIYWKYESKLKEMDAKLYSVVGAAGEIFSIRAELYEDVPEDIVIEDFYMTLRIAEKGYRIAYEPNAYASEGASASVKEELKRKIRIAAGGIQAIVRLKGLLNVFKHGVLSFQYISHRVLRWTITPIALLLLLVSNIYLYFIGGWFYQLTLIAQVLMYLFALIGFALENKAIRVKMFFVPYYFFIMNYAVYRGLFRYLGKKQSVVWERAERAKL